MTTHPHTKTVADARKEFAAARTKHRNLRLKRYEGRNNGGDATYNLERATALVAGLPRELQGLLWAEHRLAERVSENRDAGQARPELAKRLAGYRRQIRMLTTPAPTSSVPGSAKLTAELNSFFGPMA